MNLTSPFTTATDCELFTTSDNPGVPDGITAQAFVPANTAPWDFFANEITAEEMYTTYEPTGEWYVFLDFFADGRQILRIALCLEPGHDHLEVIENLIAAHGFLVVVFDAVDNGEAITAAGATFRFGWDTLAVLQLFLSDHTTAVGFVRQQIEKVW